MKKYLFLLLIIPLTFIGCQKKVEQEIISIPEPAPRIKTLSVTGISENYIIPISNVESDSPHVTNISFNISNDTDSDYPDYIITPIFRVSDSDVILSEADGLTYTVNKNDTLLSGSTDDVVISVIYTGSARENIELSFTVSSGYKEEVLKITSKVFFYTYLQAFLYNDDNSSLIITSDTQITASPESPLKIIFVNALSSETESVPLAIKFAGNTKGTGILSFPSDNIIFNDNPIRVCEENGNDEATFIIINSCYIELTATASDIWSYIAVTGGKQQAGSVNINVDRVASDEIAEESKEEVEAEIVPVTVIPKIEAVEPTTIKITPETEIAPVESKVVEEEKIAPVVVEPEIEAIEPATTEINPETEIAPVESEVVVE